jgi:hypothetical protein
MADAKVTLSRMQMKMTKKRRETEARERDLKICVVNHGGTEIRIFKSPQDGEGVSIRLTEREGEELAYALSKRGPHFILRDDAGGDSSSL